MRFLIAIILVSIVTGCSYTPIWVKELPAECNMALNNFKIYYNTKDKSATVPPTDYCYKKLHRLACQEETFGLNEYGLPNAVDYDNPKLYRNYTQCLTELD